MTVDWSVVRRDDDGDWRTWGLGGVPEELPVYNKHLAEGDWRDIATFAGAVAAAMAAEDQERRLRNERLHSHVAGRLQAATPIPNQIAELAIAAVREFEEGNPVD